MCYDIPFIISCFIVAYAGTTNHSGSALTAFLNEHTNIALWSLYWINEKFKLKPEWASARPTDLANMIMSNLEMTFHGDDMVVGNNDQEVNITAEAFRDFVKELGFTFTPSDKTEHFKVHKNISTVQYLKRFPGFVGNQWGYLRAQRPIDDIYQALYWREKNSDLSWENQVLDSVLKDISHYDESVFNVERKRLQGVAEELKLDWHPKTYFEHINECKYTNFESRSYYGL